MNVRFLSRIEILDFTEAAIARYISLKSLNLNIGKMDLRIASIVLETQGVLVTRNRRDFERVPGLACVDWSVWTYSSQASRERLTASMAGSSDAEA